MRAASFKRLLGGVTLRPATLAPGPQQHGANEDEREGGAKVILCWPARGHNEVPGGRRERG